MEAAIRSGNKNLVEYLTSTIVLQRSYQFFHKILRISQLVLFAGTAYLVGSYMAGQK